MLRYEDLSEALIHELKVNGIAWEPYKKIYLSNLHRDFYLKITEAKSEDYLYEFCGLVQYLRGHLEYGVSREWGNSELNRIVYTLKKENLIHKFPLTIDSLSRFYNDSDIITFYKKTLKAKDPTIIDLIGTTGAGKTTFCQQFVNDEGKDILEKTITPSGNSTIIQTDIVILEETNSRLFLKARNKRDIVRDIIFVALSVDTEFDFDLNKSINDAVNKKGIKKSVEKDIKVESEIFQGVYNLFRTESLMKAFLEIARELQDNFNSEDDIQEYINNNMIDSSLAELLDDIIKTQLGIENFYGYRHEMLLESDYILEKTIIPTKTFEKYKERNEEFSNIISYRILFEQAVLVLKCDEKAKLSLPLKFRKGIVFRDSQGHKKSEQVGIATDFEVKNKILLIPAGTGGELVDDKYIEELKNIIISEPKQNIVVITKLDKASSYEQYNQGDYNGFIESLKEQVVTTHNNLIDKLEDSEEQNGMQPYKLDKNALVKKFIESFDNAFLSKITKDSDGNFDAELHRIMCRNKNSQEITTSDIEDIGMVEGGWHTLISGILDREYRLSYDEGDVVLRCSDSIKKKETISELAVNMNGMLNVCYENFKWEQELHTALNLYSKDFRYIYHELYLWNSRSINRDTTTSGYDIEEKAGKLVNYINSLVLKSDASKNAVEAILESILEKYLDECYSFNKLQNSSKLAKMIISSAISRATIVSYKLFDRKIINNSSSENIRIIYRDTKEYIQPPRPIEEYDVNKRSYYTNTAYFLGIYCNLLSKFKYNLDKYFIDVFKAIIESELEKLEGKAQ